MPKFLENILKKAASSKGFKGRKADEYVYGAMNNMGAMRGNKETAMGKSMQAKHNKKLSASAATRIRAKASRISGY